MIWITLTILATIFQTFRNIEQKNLGKKMDALSASWSRFILPFPLAIFAVITSFGDINHNFILSCLICAFFQVFGNVLLIKTLQSKNFSIGITFYKTETLQAVIAGALIFNQLVSATEIVAIIIATCGVIMISGIDFKHGKKEFFASLKSPSSLYGLACGFCFSITGFNLKNATIALINMGYSHINSALLTLMWVIFFQNFLFILIKFFQKKLLGDLKNIFLIENKKTFIRAAFFSFLGSICWFVAYAYGNVIHIKTLGQIELIFALLVSHFLFKEKNKPSQIIGIFLVSIGILIVLFGAN